MNAMLAAVEDGARLVAWAEPNTAVYNDKPAELVLLKAMRHPVPSEMAIGVPLLRYCDPDVNPVPLLEALMDGQQSRTARCERCTAPSGWFRLLVPAGASVMALHLCIGCRNELREAFPGLVWG